MTPLVLVHGFMGGSAQWELQRELAETRELIAVDLPGFGANASLEAIGSIDALADWVLEYLEGLGVRRFHLLGHSMGGMIVQDMVRKVPEHVTKLILYGTGSVGVLPGRFETVETSLERAANDGPKATARRIAATWFRDGEAADQYEACARIAEGCSMPAIMSGLTAMKNWSGVDALEQISSPTLVLWGDCDQSYPWSQTQTLWKLIPRSYLAVLPDCAHAVHLERPELFNRIVDHFIRY